MIRGRKGTNYLFFVFVILFFSLLYKPEGGDFWSYYKLYELGSDFPYKHMEQFYYWVMELIPNNYIMWRIAIWLPSAIFIALIFKLLKIPSCIATTIFLSFALTSSYYYTRNVLALSVLYIGLTLCSINLKFHNSNYNQLMLKSSGDNNMEYLKFYNYIFKYKYIGLLLFLTLAIISWFLHKSMPMYILVAVISIFLPYNKKYIYYAIILFPFLYGIIMLVADHFLQMDEIWVVQDSGKNYLYAINAKTVNWKGVIALVFKYIPYLYFYLAVFLNPLEEDNFDFKSFKTFLFFSFFTFYLSFLFLGHGSSAIQGRIYKSSMLPFSIMSCIYFKHKMQHKQCKMLIKLILFYYAFNCVLSIYINL